MEKEEKITSPVEAGTDSTPVEAAPEAAPAKGHHHEGGRKGQGGRRTERRAPAEKLYEERVVKIRRVCKTTKGGRHMRFSALVVVGDVKGKYGFGVGKSGEVSEAIKKALDDAKLHMYRLPIVKDGTIPHTVVGTYGATTVFLKPAPDGTGIIAGGPVRAVLELGGVKNIYSKVYGSRSPINIVKATVNGLLSLKSYTQVNKLRHGEDK